MRTWLPITILAATGCATIYSPQSLVTEQPIPPPAEATAEGTLTRREDRILVSAHSLNPSHAPALFERVAESVISVWGSRSRGSGFVISREGLALTNHHLIEGQENLRARFRDGHVVAIRVIRSDPASDVALLQLPCGQPCTTVTLGGDDIVVGSDVYIIGTPLSDFLSHTLTKGIVSGLRSRNGIARIQTDAAINRGSSGGPMVDAASGRVIGIVSSKLVGGDVEGIGFGTAITDALRLLRVDTSADDH